MKRKFLATLCAAMVMISTVSTAQTLRAEEAPAKVDLNTVTAAIPDGYAAYYSFDGDLKDAVSGKSGHTTGRFCYLEADDENASYEDGVDGKAVSFAGFGDGVSLPVGPSSRQYTVSIDLFVKKAGQFTPAVFLANLYEDGSIKGSDEDGQWVSIAVLGWHDNIADGPMVWSRNVPGDAPWNDLHAPGNASIAENKWFNLTVVADGATATIYVDGSPIVTGPIADIIDETTEIYLGVNAWDAVFSGLMDNLYVYDRTLSADEVASLAKASLDPSSIPSAKSNNVGLIVGIVIAVVVVGGVAVVVMKKKKGASK